MRWPIQLQLLLPMLAVVVVAVGTTAGVASYLEGAWVRSQIEEDLRNTVTTLTHAYFPLTRNVLEQMSGLSGAEFVLLDAGGSVRQTSLPAPIGDTRPLMRLAPAATLEDFSQSPTVAIAGTRYLAGRVQLPRDEAGASLLVLYPETRWWGESKEAALTPLLAGLVSGLVALGLTALLARQFVGPIRRLKQQTVAIAGGDFTPVTVPGRDDEIRELAASINEMAGRLATYEEQIRRNERLRTLGTLGAGMAHQLRNWVAGARLAVEHLQLELPPEADRELVDIALRQLTLMTTYLQRFLRLGQDSHPPHHEPLDVAQLAEEVLMLVRPACQHAKLQLTYTPTGEPIPACGDADALRQVLVNLLMNAIEAAATNGHGGEIGLEIERRPDEVRLHILDSGPGPEPAMATQLFEPFVSNKADGTGLGLPVAEQIAREHGGRIRFSRRESMTCFTVELPVDLK